MSEERRPGSLVWRDAASWQDRFFGLRRAGTRLPRGYRSGMMQSLIAAADAEETRAQMVMAEAREHVRQLAEQAEVAELAPLVERFGAAAVTAIMRRVDPGFLLPRCLGEREED